MTRAGLRLRDTEGFVVESPEGSIGWVEEVWLSDTDEPLALAVRTRGRRHGLLLSRDVLAVDRVNRSVAVPTGPELLELCPPRLVFASREDTSIVVAASWRTTGETLKVRGRRRRGWPRPVGGLRLPAAAEREPRLVGSAAVLLVSATAIAALLIMFALVGVWLTGNTS